MQKFTMLSDEEVMELVNGVSFAIGQGQTDNYELALVLNAELEAEIGRRKTTSEERPSNEALIWAGNVVVAEYENVWKHRGWYRGVPQATAAMTTEQLQSEGYVGVYRGLGTGDRPSSADRERHFETLALLPSFSRLREEIQKIDLSGVKEGP